MNRIVEMGSMNAKQTILVLVGLTGSSIFLGRIE